MTRISLIRILLLFVFSVSKILSAQVQIDYMDQNFPDNIPKVFSPNLISLPDRLEQGATFSADGKWFIYGILGMQTSPNYFMYMHYQNKVWSEPKIFDAIDTDSVFLPTFSPHGNTLFFDKSKPLKDFGFTDIWQVNFYDSVWSKPNKLSENVNSFSREGSHAATNSGNLYFTSNRYDTIYNCCADIFVAEYNDGDYSPAKMIELFEEVGDEEGVFVSPNEKYMIIQSNRVETNYEHHDLYISYLLYNNEWSKPVQLNTDINSKALEQRPFVSPDSKFLFFNRMVIKEGFVPQSSDLYWVSVDKVFAPHVFRPIADTVFNIGTALNFKIPDDTFKDVDDETLSYTVNIKNDNESLDWLSFDANELSFKGTTFQKQEITIEVLVTDSKGNMLVDEFVIVME